MLSYPRALLSAHTASPIPSLPGRFKPSVFPFPTRELSCCANRAALSGHFPWELPLSDGGTPGNHPGSSVPPLTSASPVKLMPRICFNRVNKPRELLLTALLSEDSIQHPASSIQHPHPCLAAWIHSKADGSICWGGLRQRTGLLVTQIIKIWTRNSPVRVDLFLKNPVIPEYTECNFVFFN